LGVSFSFVLPLNRANIYIYKILCFLLHGFCNNIYIIFSRGQHRYICLKIVFEKYEDNDVSTKVTKKN